MRFFLVTRYLLLTAAAVVLASCGHKSSPPPDTTPASITTTSSSFSLNHGEVATLSSADGCVASPGLVCVQVLNSSNTAITSPKVTYTSATPSLVTVNASGEVCAGVFDANNVVCQTRDANGNLLPDQVVNINITSGSITTAFPVYVHGRVDKVEVDLPSNPPVCVSQHQTEQFTVKAFSAGQDVTTKVGPFTWATGNSTIATVDQNGVVTSQLPGATTVVASIGTISPTAGTPGIFVACPPKTISLHISGASDTTFNVASGTAQTLTADVTDILGQPITFTGSNPLTYSSFVPTAASIASGGAVSTPGAGVSTLVVSCTPPGCNPAPGPNVNFNGTGVGQAVYSNPVLGTITGTTATTIYVTGSDNPDGSANKSLIPIDSGTNTAGTAVTLGGVPNSMVFSPDGTKAYIGSDAGLLIFDPGTNTVTATASGLTGKVLKVSNNGTKIVISDTAAGKVFVFDASPNVNSAQEFDIANVTAADFASDNSKAYFTSGSTVYEYSPSTGLKTLSFGADGVVFTPQGSVAFFGGSSVLGLATCNDSSIPGAAGAANVLAVAPDGTHMIGVGSGGWLDLAYTIAALANVGCPVTESNTIKTGAFPAFVGTPTQIAIASDDSNAFLTGYTGGSDATGVPFYHLVDGTTGTIALSAGGPLFSGGLTQDAHSLYVGVGGASPAVHRIDLTAAGTPDANQISVSFNPRIVVVRPK
ncbi:MAG TPA: Ig-like domain-containing protein [Terriglobales bacterium]|nr:Ig-like domain-containing protein [Terriglobales bacterium]